MKHQTKVKWTNTEFYRPKHYEQYWQIKTILHSARTENTKLLKYNT